MPFIDINFDEGTRTFRGVIPWMDRYQTTWSGCTSWHYEILFDTEYTCILSGTVKMKYFEDRDFVRNDTFNYGTRLIYLNAAVLQKMTFMMNSCREDLDSADNDEGISREVLRSFRDNKKALKERLLKEGASQQTIWQLNDVWKEY